MQLSSTHILGRFALSQELNECYKHDLDSVPIIEELTVFQERQTYKCRHMKKSLGSINIQKCIDIIGAQRMGSEFKISCRFRECSLKERMLGLSFGGFLF